MSRRHPLPTIWLMTDERVGDLLGAIRRLPRGAGVVFRHYATPAEERRRLWRAVRRVAAGEATLSPSVLRQLIGHVAGPDHGARAAARRALDGLSPRERDVALAIGRGRSNAEIGAELYLSVATVKANVSRLLVKLELSNRVQIALLVHDAGLG